jgi:hypothetical protein
MLCFVILATETEHLFALIGWLGIFDMFVVIGFVHHLYCLFC